MRFENKIN